MEEFSTSLQFSLKEVRGDRIESEILTKREGRKGREGAPIQNLLQKEDNQILTGVAFTSLKQRS